MRLHSRHDGRDKALDQEARRAVASHFHIRARQLPNTHHAVQQLRRRSLHHLSAQLHGRGVALQHQIGIHLLTTPLTQIFGFWIGILLQMKKKSIEER